MSGSRLPCSCPKTHCLGGYCRCFKAKLFCSPSCTCKGCLNTESNKAAVDSQYEAYLQRRGGFLAAPEGSNGCTCKKTNCIRIGLCGCVRRSAKCTSKCSCQDCANRGSDRKVEREQGDDNSSMAEQPAQIQEQPTQSGENSGSGVRSEQTTTNW